MNWAMICGAVDKPRGQQSKKPRSEKYKRDAAWPSLLRVDFLFWGKIKHVVIVM